MGLEMSLPKMAKLIWPIPFCIVAVYLLFMTEGNEVILLIGLSGFLFYYAKIASGVRMRMRDKAHKDRAERSNIE
jgi:hypothetical protein